LDTHAGGDLADSMNIRVEMDRDVAGTETYLAVGMPADSTPMVVPSPASQLKFGDHGCLIYRNGGERLSFIVEYFGDGVARGEKCLYFLHDHKLDDTLFLLEQRGFPARSLLMSGGLSISGCKDMFYPGGVFSPDESLANHRKQVIDALAKGYQGIRILADMGWALGGVVGAERLMEFEARLNYFSGVMDSITVCQYHQGLFPPELIFNAMQTHQIVIKDGLTDKNPYYLEPEVFLASDSALIPRNTFIKRETGRGGHEKKTVERVREDFRNSLNKFGLTPQETRVVELMLLFKTNGEMSQELFISTNTVKQHMKNIYRKVGISKRLELVTQFMKMLEAD